MPIIRSGSSTMEAISVMGNAEVLVAKITSDRITSYNVCYTKLLRQSYWFMGVAGALGLFLSIIVHEFSHSYVAKRYGLPMKGITLFIFGGVAEMGDEPPSAKVA